jgi:hypothetical protein
MLRVTLVAGSSPVTRFISPLAGVFRARRRTARSVPSQVDQPITTYPTVVPAQLPWGVRAGSRWALMASGERRLSFGTVADRPLTRRDLRCGLGLDWVLIGFLWVLGQCAIGQPS